MNAARWVPVVAACGAISIAGAGAGVRVARAEPTADPGDDDDDDAVHAAHEANLESDALRRGVTFGAAIGPSATIGIGVSNAVGKGGGFSFRVGHVATRSTLITLEIVGASFLHATGDSSATLSTAVSLAAGLQHYASPTSAIWYRLAGGIGTFTRDTPGEPAHVTGVTGVGGIGVDVARLRFFTIDVELFATGLLAGGGMVTAGALCIGGAIY